MARHDKIFGASLILLALLCAPRASAQSGTPPVVPAERAAQQQQRPSQSGADQLELMRALNLTPEQRARVAEIRRETEAQARLDNVRVRRARRALEEAIYAEDADESLIDARSREVAEAEAARVRSRAAAELKVRRVLKPEQLGTFRELRRQAALNQRRQRRESGVVGGSDANPQALPPRLRRRIERGRRPRP